MRCAARWSAGAVVGGLSLRGAAGMALVAVMWVVAALSIFAMSLAASSRGEVRGAQSARGFAEAAAYGDAAIQLAARELKFATDTIDRRLTLSYTIDGRQLVVRVSPGGGFVDLNGAPEALLRDLFVFGAGLDADNAELLAQRIADWRDPDEDALPLGAENPAYEAAGVAFRTRGGPFDTPEDLLQVLGVSFDIYDKIHNFVTTQTGAAGVDPFAASKGVLRVLAQGDAAVADAFSAARDAKEPSIDTTAFTQEHILSSSGTVYYIEAFYPGEGGRTLARARWVDLGVEGPAGLPWRSMHVEPVRSFVSEDGHGA